MRGPILALVFITAITCGCSGRTISVSGTVKSKAGTPVTGVFIAFLPVEGPRANIRAFPLDANGGFEGELVAGSYIYYLSPMSVETDEDGVPIQKAEIRKQKEHEKAYAKVPRTYRTHENAAGDRRVQITSSGTTLSLQLAE